MTENNYSPEIDQQLQSLAQLCCDSIDKREKDFDERSQSLLDALIKSGFARLDGVSLQRELEDRVKQMCGNTAMHRGGEISQLSTHLQQQLDDRARWDSKRPATENPPQAANARSAEAATNRQHHRS